MAVSPAELKALAGDAALPDDVRAAIDAFLDRFGGAPDAGAIASFLKNLTSDQKVALGAIDPDLLDELFAPAAGDEPGAPQGRFQDASALEMPKADMGGGDLPDLTDVTETADFSALPVSGDDIYQPDQGTDMMRLLKGTPGDFSPPVIEVPVYTMNPIGEIRQITGAGNNLAHTEYGQARQPFISRVGYAYDDGYGAPRETGMPNAREVSNQIIAQSGDMSSSSGLSNLLWIWGQFIDHDITLTLEGHGESYNIAVPMGDPHFDPFYTGTQYLTLTRSGYMDGTGTGEGNPRTQINVLTAYVDGSQVYGSDAVTEARLRGAGGKMKVDENGLLPVKIGMRGPEFDAGDGRATENVALAAMHTLFVREHNFWVDKISAANPTMTDEELYQTAKAIVEAEIQKITYDEFLTHLLGKDALEAYRGYDPDIDPSVTMEFATAAFRVGHTMLSPQILRLQEDGSESALGHLTLQNAFFRADVVLTGGIDEILRGVSGSYSQTIDGFIIDDVRNFLFGPPGAGGMDLATLNIQRGRDHGMAGYNDIREAYGLGRIESFDDLTSDPALIAKLTALYGTPDHMDLWVGGLLEPPHGDGLVGETFFAIIADQFTRLRDGDRFWYEDRLDDALLEIVRNTSLSDVILRNSDTDFLQNDAFLAAIRRGGDEGDNNLAGTDARDLLIGFGGNDVLSGGKGEDTLYGGAGGDIFLFDTASVFDGIDTIRDFSASEGDRVDLGDLLAGYDPLHDLITDYVRAISTAEGTWLEADLDGTGAGHGFERFALLENVPSVTLEEILVNPDIA